MDQTWHPSHEWAHDIEKMTILSQYSYTESFSSFVVMEVILMEDFLLFSSFDGGKVDGWANWWRKIWWMEEKVMEEKLMEDKTYGGKIDGPPSVWSSHQFNPPSVWSPHQFNLPSVWSSHQNFFHQLRITTKNLPSVWPPTEFLPSNEEKVYCIAVLEILGCDSCPAKTDFYPTKKRWFTSM